MLKLPNSQPTTSTSSKRLNGERKSCEPTAVSSPCGFDLATQSRADASEHWDMVPIVGITPFTLLGDAAALFLAHLQALVDVGRLSPRTLYTRDYGLRFLGHLAGLPVGEVRRSQVIAWLQSLPLAIGKRGDPLTSVDYTALRALQALLTWCADRDACVSGLANRIQHGYAPPPKRALTRDEMALLHAELARTCIRNTREGRWESTGIHLLQVLADCAARTYEVRCATGRQYDRAHGVIRWKRGKNGSPRVIILGEIGRAICEARVNRHNLDQYLFPNADGEALSHQGLSQLFLRAVTRAGISNPETLTLHDLRRTAATLTYEEGAALADVSAMLGHQNVEQTKRTYLMNSVDPGARRAANVLGRRAS